MGRPTAAAKTSSRSDRVRSNLKEGKMANEEKQAKAVTPWRPLKNKNRLQGFNATALGQIVQLTSRVQ